MVVKERITTFFPGQDAGGFSETVDLRVAPAKATYDVKKLHSLMLRLIPNDIPPTRVYDFHQNGRHIRFGKLYFCDRVGVRLADGNGGFLIEDRDFLSRTALRVEAEKLNVSVEDRDLATGKTTWFALKRRVCVRLYPEEALAERGDDSCVMTDEQASREAERSAGVVQKLTELFKLKGR